MSAVFQRRNLIYHGVVGKSTTFSQKLLIRFCADFYVIALPC